MKTTTLRMPAELVEALEIIAQVQGVSLAAVIREAIETCVTDRSQEPDFHARLDAVVQEMQDKAQQLGRAFDEAG